MSDYTATYSPEDNKLRLYAVSRLPRELYDEVKSHGFKWAPKQELFVAPMWTPEREDFLLSLVDEIEDEDKSLVDRAEQRADRFEDYSDRRRDDAHRAREAVSAIADNIPLGQPILVGHHSERHARRDAERIENGMRRAVQMWSQSEYWRQRAAGAIRHAKYKERPDVRARRIRTIEADKRKQERAKVEAEKHLAAWSKEGLTHDEALAISNHCYLLLPRKEGDRPDFSGQPTAYGALTNDHPTLYAPRSLEEVVAHALATFPRLIARAERWIAHYDNRLTYERAMLDEQGGTVTDRKGPERGGGVRCWCSPGYGKGWSYIQKVNKVSVTVLDNWGNGGRNFTRTIRFDDLKAVMSAAEVSQAKEAGRLHETDDGLGFYLDEPAESRDEAKERTHREAVAAAANDRQAEAADFKRLENVKVETVVAPQLFPTPPDLAAQMAEAAGFEAGQRVLEPSAGTGNLLRAVADVVPLDSLAVHAVEINLKLADRLRSDFPAVTVHARNFLECEPAEFEPFDRVVMNPEFVNAADIRHIIHAEKMLRPGGRLVALCAAGNRQRAKLKPLADRWEELPEGSFSEQGTDVRVALLVICKTPEPSPRAYQNDSARPLLTA